MRNKYLSLGASAVIGVCLLALTFVFLSPDENYREISVPFEFQGSSIAGKLVLPLSKNKEPIDCVVFVHGDGAMTHDVSGYLVPYFSHFAQKNMCSLSWDKPGVNGSNGDWLDFTMQDRAALVEAAIAALRSNTIQPVDQIGLIGFSQAGWVMPKVDPTINDVAFYIFVSPAVNWMRQSAYMSALRQVKEPVDRSKQQRDKAIDDLLLSGASYERFETLVAGDPDVEVGGLSHSRWDFLVKNVHSDLSADLVKLKNAPVLLLAGGRDGQVDALETADVFNRVLGATHLRSHVFEKAGHSMVEVAERRPMQDWDGLWLIVQIGFMGRDAFVEGYWTAIDEFIAVHLEQ